MPLIAEFALNAALMLALAVIYGLFQRFLPKHSLQHRLAMGATFGVFAVIGMTVPVNLLPGVIFDGRSIVMTAAGVFGGPIPAALAAAIASVYRFELGGVGVLPGIGTIVTSALLGVGYHRWRQLRADLMRPLPLFGLGLVVHVAVLLWQTTLPGDLAATVIPRVAPPMVAIFPLATVLVISLIKAIEESAQNELAVREREEWLRRVVDESPFPSMLIAEDGQVLSVNRALTETSGYEPKQIGTVDRWSELALERPALIALPSFNTVFDADRRIDSDDTRIRTAAGEVRYWRFSTAPVGRLPDGRRVVINSAVDVTEQHELRRELSFSDALVQQSRECLYCVDPEDDFRFVFVNDATCRHFGRSRAELLQMGIPDIDPSFSKARLAADWDERGDQRVIETTNVTADGRKVPVEVFTNKVRVNGRDLDMGIIHDLSARRQAEQALRAERERLSNIIEGTRAGTWEWNVQTGETRFNERWSEIVGYTLAELQPTTIETWLNLVHPDDRARSASLLQQHFDGRLPYYECEARMRHKKGNWVWVLDRGKIVTRDAGGKPEWMAGTHTDIDQLKTFAEGLREREQALRSILLAAPLGISVISEHRIVQTNRSFCDMLGYTEDELANKPFAMLFEVEPEHARIEALLESQIRVGGTGNLETRLRRKNGQNVEVLLQAALLDPDDPGRGMTLTATDITPLQDMSRQLRQAQKLEALGTLAGGISHDFNNILSSIIGFTDLARRRIDANSPIARYLEQVRVASGRASELVKQILSFARRSGEELSPINLAPIVKEVVAMLRATLPATIEMRTDIRSDALVMANAVEIHQVVVNLCTNAAHAMEENGGMLTIELHDNTAEQQIELNVRDTGSGIPEALRESVFDPYFTTKPKEKGSGLGLAVVQGIVQRCQGRIGLDSQVGVGTTVTIKLPIASPAATAEEARERFEILQTGSGQILFVDDDAAITEVGKETLTSLGYEVDAFNDPTAALDRFQASPHDYCLVISDVTMPRLSGDKLAAEILALRPDVPIILCTGYTDRLTERSARKLGAKGLMHKPLSMAALARTVSAAIGGN